MESNNDLYRLLVENVLEFAIFFVDVNGRIATWNLGAEQLTGYTQDAMGMPVSDLYAEGELKTALTDTRTACLRDGESRVVDAELLCRDGSILVVSASVQAIRDVGGRLIGSGETIRDLSKRVAAQEAHNLVEQQFRKLVNGVVDYAIFMIDLDGHVRTWNAGARRIKGYTADEILGQHFSILYTESDRRIGEPNRALDIALRTGRFENEGWRTRKDGSLFWANVVIDRIDDDAGHPIGFAKVTRDATSSRNAETQLEQMRLALHQSQKMEALGHLTGGVAHDFNNLLQVISGNLQLLSDDASSETGQRRIANAMAGVARGSKLASQLLSFARRQPLAPKVVNPGKLIRGMDDLLRHTLGEGVEIETVVAGGLWNSLIDRANLENALLNLAINARDAMGGRGRLTIEAGNAFLDDHYVRTHHEVKAGQYVLLAVTDNGPGIPADLLDKVFEPFFTTKPEGTGTGLGLSMVYGFVKQSGGHIKIYSELGLGTTVRIYLPRSMEEEEASPAKCAEPNRGGTETILVVEDDDEVRDTSVALLRRLGYTVLQASDAQRALAIVESGVPLDLLFTDVVMPGPLGSPDLAIRARQHIPHLAVLFTSGYTANAIVHGGRLDQGLELLSKPYTHEALACKVRDVIDQTRASRPADEPNVSLSRPHSEKSRRRCLQILFCEDAADIRMTIRDILESKGHVVQEARSAEAALALFSPGSTDLLITDLALPGSSGNDLVKNLRHSNPDLPVLFTTGRLTPDVALDARSRVLIKPFGVEALVEAISELDAELPPSLSAPP